MRARIDVGRLVERSTGTGTDRTAYGGFVGPNGEPAGYAVGWSTDTDPPEGRITVGIGTGTFHARVHDRGDDWAHSLTDQRFADLPEGGSHLTAAGARGHAALPFVWQMAAVVVERDPRAQWMAHWMAGTIAVTTRRWEQVPSRSC